MPSSSTFGLLLLYFFLMLPPKCSLQESSTTSASPAPESSLPKCRNYQQACAVELIRFPTLEEPTTTAEPTTTTAVAATRTSKAQQQQQQSAIGIGTTTFGGEVQLEGSGEEEEELPPVDVDADEPPIQFVPIGARFPLYDEFVPTTPVYDYAAEPVDRQQQQICACPEEEQCGGDTGDEQRTLPFSPQIRASFCKPLDEVFKLRCKGTRTLARVICTLDVETEDRLSAVNDTLVFCRCESSRWAQVMVEPWINNAFAFSYKCLEK